MKKGTKNENGHVSRLCRELFFVWAFLAQEGLLDEALEFLKEHGNDPAPFDLMRQSL